MRQPCEKNPLNKVSRQGGDVFVVKGERRRRLHKALLRYHDPAGWPMIREALLEMGKGHLIGNGPNCLVPPEGRGEAKAERSINKGLKPALTRHSAITHQRSNGAGNKAAAGNAGNKGAAAQGDSSAAPHANKGARSEAASVNNGGANKGGHAGVKVGNGKPAGAAQGKGIGTNGKPPVSQSKPAHKGAASHKGKVATRAGTSRPATKPAATGGKPAAKRPARWYFSDRKAIEIKRATRWSPFLYSYIFSMWLFIE